MFNNPLIKRYSFSTLRPKQVLMFGLMYVTVVCLILFINYSIFQYQDMFDTIGEFWQSLYYQFLVFQILFLWMWGSFNSNSAITDEIVNKSYDFFRLLPLPAWKKAVGVLIGKNLLVLHLAGINFVFLLVFGIAGKVDAMLQVQIFLVLVSVAALVNIASLLSAIAVPPKKKNPNIIVIILCMFFVMPYLMGGVVALSQQDEFQNTCGSFFGIDIPVLLLCFVIAVYFSVWAFKGVVRKFNREREPLFSVNGSFVFTIGFEFLCLGLFWKSIAGAIESVFSFWFVTFAAAALTLFASLKSVNTYIEYSRVFLVKQKGLFGALVSYSNMSVGFRLFVFWLIPAVGVIFVANEFSLAALMIVGVIASFYLFMLLLAEMRVLYNTSNNKTGWLFGFIFILYLFVPLILAGAMDMSLISAFSPFGYVFSVYNGEIEDRGAVDTMVCVLNLILSVVPCLIVFKRYALIAETRRRM